MASNKTRAELQAELDDANEHIADLESKLEEIVGIAELDEDDDTEDDDSEDPSPDDLD